MSNSRRFAKIDADATVDEHFACIRSQGESYLTRALKQNASPIMRQRIIIAALRYLETRNRDMQPSAAMSSSQGPIMSQTTAAGGRDSSFQSVLASLLDEDVSSDVLIDSCVKSADYQLTPILVKCLFILTTKGSITHQAPKDSTLALESQSQYNDAELLGMDQSGADNKRNADSDATSMRSHVNVRRTGQSFVDEFVTRLADPLVRKSMSQLKTNDVFVASVVKEAPLTENAAKSVLVILTRRMQKVDLFELPAFIYQLLLFASSRGSSSAKSVVLTSIAAVFTKLEKTTKASEELSQSILAEDEDAIIAESVSPKELRQVQGTALVHIEYALRQDPTLSAEVLKLAKAGVETPKHFLTSFGMGIFLSMARTSSIQNDILGNLRDAIVRFDKERLLRSQNVYIARVSMHDDDMLDLHQSLLYIVECTCENGWDYVKESMLQMALLLIDKPLPYTFHPGDKTESLGEVLIFRLFNAHKSMRAYILDQLTSRIALQEKAATQAIRIIKKLADRIPYYVLEFCRYIRDGIEFLVTLPPWLASALISAYKPLLMARQDLQDYFQLVVRKALFHRDTSSRAVAIIGFLSLTSLHGKNQAASSQRRRNSSSQRAGPSNSESIMDSVLDSLQPLRRIFSYPAALKAFLYKQAIQLLSEETPDHCISDVATAIGELLRSHLQRFVNPTEAPHISLEHCVKEAAGGRLEEPLGDLIWCLAVVEWKRDVDGYKNSYIVDLARKLACVSLEDFSISKELVPPAAPELPDGVEEDEEIKSAAATARANRNRLRVLGSVCEALVHTVLIIPRESHEWKMYSEIVIPLMSLRARIFEQLRTAGMASSSEAFNDLGGDLGIEFMRAGAKMGLQRGAKSSGKKASGSKKGKSKDSNGGAPLPASAQDHRFGVFSVLSSAATKPTLPLKTAMEILEMIDDAVVPDKGPAIFTGHTESRDFEQFRSYLLAVAQKHVEDFSYSMSKEVSHITLPQHSNGVLQSIKSLVRIVMQDFKRFRRSTSPTPGQGGTSSLQIADRCACAVTHLQLSNKRAILQFCHSLLPDSVDEISKKDANVCETATEALENLIESLVEDKLVKECTLVLRIYDSVTQAISRSFNSLERRLTFLEKRWQWAVELLTNKEVGDAGVVKSLVQVCLFYVENNDDLRRAGSLGRCILENIGDCDENVEPTQKEVTEKSDELSRAVAIDQGTCLSAMDMVFEVVDHAITDIEWCLGRMTSLESNIASAPAGDMDNVTKPAEDSEYLAKLAKHAIRAEDAAQHRLEGVIRTLQVLARCAIAKWVQQEKLLRIITKAYKMLCIASQAQCKRKGDPRTSYVSLINECKSLAPTLWTFLSFIGTGDDGGPSSKGPSRAAKEARVMPQLVYEVERFEKVLIGVQKRTKVSLLRGMRRNVARDFRIREDRLVEEEEGSDGGREEQAPKRSRRA